KGINKEEIFVTKDLRDVIKDSEGRNLEENQNGIVKYFKGYDKKYYMLDDIEDFKDPETDEYLVKVKVAGTNNLHTYILIKGFPVYFDIKLNELDMCGKPNYQIYSDILKELQKGRNYKNTEILNEAR
ncbi:11816_t:CDS:2, partial [Dentiscutata heterogama]